VVLAAGREGVTQQFADGVYWNKAQQPQSYLYDPGQEPSALHQRLPEGLQRPRHVAGIAEEPAAVLELVPVELQLRVQPAHRRPRRRRSGGGASLLSELQPSFS
jgi:hypothetical protein